MIKEFNIERHYFRIKSAYGRYRCCLVNYQFTTFFAYENIVYAQYAEQLEVLPDQFPNRYCDFKNMDDCYSLFATLIKSNL